MEKKKQLLNFFFEQKIKIKLRTVRVIRLFT